MPFWWGVPLWAWTDERREMLFLAMTQRPDWVAKWPEARRKWLAVMIEHDSNTAFKGDLGLPA